MFHLLVPFITLGFCAILPLAATEVTIPIGWVLSAFAFMGTALSVVAGTFWTFVQKRFAEQDETIDHLRSEVATLSKGCGVDACNWWRR